MPGVRLLPINSMGGFLSEYTRDLIALFGLILSLIGTIISALTLFSNNGTTDYAKDNSECRVKTAPLWRVIWKFVFSPSTEESEDSFGVKILILLTLFIFLVNIVTSWRVTNMPHEGDAAQLPYVNVVATFLELFFLTLTVAGIKGWLEKNPSLTYKRYLKQWNVFWFWCWLMLVLSSAFILVTIKTGSATNWLVEFIFLQAVGIIMSHVIVILFLAYVFLSEIFKSTSHH